jgi:hypothetical protein
MVLLSFFAPNLSLLILQSACLQDKLGSWTLPPSLRFLIVVSIMFLQVGDAVPDLCRFGLLVFSTMFCGSSYRLDCVDDRQADSHSIPSGRKQGNSSLPDNTDSL